MMAPSHNVSASLEVFPLTNRYSVEQSRCSDFDRIYLPVTDMVSSLKLGTDASNPDICSNSSTHSFSTQWSIDLTQASNTINHHSTNERLYDEIDDSASVSSADTLGSTDTTQASNTTKRQSEKEREKKKFYQFVRILLRILKEQDEDRFQKARAIISACERRKRLGKIESITESVRCPLKNAVGLQFWEEAREQLTQKLMDSKTEISSIDTSIESDIATPYTMINPIHRMNSSNSRPSTIVKSEKVEHNRGTSSQRKRIWMIIRVFLKYLRCEHCHLYGKAHSLVTECCAHHQKFRHFESSNSLSGRIQTCLKNEFGLEHWRRAELLVTQALRA